MRRLKDLDAPASPIEAEAVDLLRAAAEYELPAGQKQRVRARLLQVRVTQRRPVSRPAVVIAVILCAAAASAAVGRHWIAQAIEVLVTPGAHRSPSAAGAAAGRTSDNIATAPLPVGPTIVEVDEPATRETTHDTTNDTTDDKTDDTTNAALGHARIDRHKRTHASRAHADRNSGHRVSRQVAVAQMGSPARTGIPAPAGEASSPTPKSTGREPIGAAPLVNVDASAGVLQDATARFMSADAASGAAGYEAGRAAGRARDPDVAAPSNHLKANANLAAVASDDTALVFEAMRALRRDKRPARASRLLDQYLRRHPDGSLCEEALALSVEAAGMRSDDARTRELVTTYLARYPSGHFRTAVEDTRARLPP